MHLLITATMTICCDDPQLSYVENFYRIYLATKLHYTTQKYDYIKHSGRILNMDITKNRKDVGLVIHLIDIVKDSPREFLKLCSANFLYGNDQFLYNEDDTIDRLYLQYKAYLSSKEYHLRRDLSLLDERVYSAGGLNAYLNKHAMTDLYSGLLRYESFVLLYQYDPRFVDNISGWFADKVTDRLRKAVTFIPINDRTKLIIRDSNLNFN